MGGLYTLQVPARIPEVAKRKEPAFTTSRALGLALRLTYRYLAYKTSI